MSNKLYIMLFVTFLDTIYTYRQILCGRTCQTLVEIMHRVTQTSRDLVQTFPSFDSLRQRLFVVMAIIF